MHLNSNHLYWCFTIFVTLFEWKPVTSESISLSISPNMSIQNSSAMADNVAFSSVPTLSISQSASMQNSSTTIADSGAFSSVHT